MITAVLIGWGYSKNKIPANVDLLVMERWCRTFCDRIVTISDKPLSSSDHLLCDTKRKLMEYLYSHRSANLLFYYTGHADDGKMVLPWGEEFDWNEIYSILTPVVHNLVMIIDCCYPPHFNLPFEYDDQWRGFSPNIHQKIILFTPCKSHEVTTSKSTGSVFTSSWIKITDEWKRNPEKRSYDNLHINGVVIYASDPHTPYFSFDQGYSVTIDGCQLLIREI